MTLDELIKLIKIDPEDSYHKVYVLINDFPGASEYWKDKYIVKADLLSIGRDYSNIFINNGAQKDKHRTVLNSWIYKSLAEAQDYFLSLIKEDNFGASWEK